MREAIQGVDLPFLGEKTSGKVRDIYSRNGQRILITTDRFSAFDRVLDSIPGKGQVLNQLSAWWFEQTADIVPNHLIAIPDPNVAVVREAQPLPIEMIVRGYITGVTSTSLWTLYAAGERQAYGVTLPDGLKKNDRLPEPILTPTTKAEMGAHDQRLTPAEIVEGGLLEKSRWEEVSAAALALFKRGMALAEKAGLVLVDTKYEFGLLDGQLMLIDEVHTPDSSRYWLQGDGVAKKDEPDNYDKEFLRRWLVSQGYRGEGDPPRLPAEIIAEAANRYIMVYERLTGQPFVTGEQPATHRIAHNLETYLGSQQ